MRVLNLSCNECGAPLEVPKRTNYVTCEFCRAQLHIVRDGGAAYTEIHELAERTDRLEVDVARLRANDELERLDRAWEREVEAYKVKGKDGESSIPTESGTIAGMAFVAIFGVVWTIMAASMGGGGVVIIGVIFVGFAIVNGFSGVNMAREYQRRRREYERERRELLARLSEE